MKIKDLNGKILKGTHLSPKTEFKKGMVPWNKGKKGVQISSKKGKSYNEIYGDKSKEILNKMSISHIGKIQSKELIQKRIESRKGYKHSKETLRKIGLSNKGKTVSLETRKKISISQTRDKIFKGFKLSLNQKERRSKKYKKWRTKVFERDNYTCWRCKSKGYLEAHHWFSFAKYPQLRFNVDNGITLCEECHAYYDDTKKRFMKLQSNSKDTVRACFRRKPASSLRV